MAIDMKAFQEMFFAECEEFLDLARAQVDSETPDINELHRCAHSIKGGADTFGLTDMVALASELERVLQQVKDGRARIGDGIGTATREALEVLRAQLSALRGGGACRREAGAAMIARLAQLRDAPDPGGGRARRSAGPRVFDLRFKVGRAVVGSDVLIEDTLASLADLGEILTVRAPTGDGGDPLWHIGVGTEREADALRAVVERVAEPGSLQIDARAADVVTQPVEVHAPPERESDRGGLETAEEAVDEAVRADMRAGHADERERPRHPYLTFLVGGQLYAVRAQLVLETRAHARVTKVAGLSGCVLGVVPFGDGVAPVVDMRALLGWEGGEFAALAAQLCVKAGGCCAVLAVEDVRDVRLLVRPRARSMPRPIAEVARYIDGFAVDDGQVTVILDPQALFAAAGILPAADALALRLGALNLALSRLPPLVLGEGVSADPGAAGAVHGAKGELQAASYGRMLDYLEDAVGTGRAALMLSRDLDHGLRYPEQARATLALLLGWIAEMLSGLDRYVSLAEGERSGAEVARPGEIAESTRTVCGRANAARAPLPKVGGGERSGRSIADEWESNL